MEPEDSTKFKANEYVNEGIAPMDTYFTIASLMLSTM